MGFPGHDCLDLTFNTEATILRFYLYIRFIYNVFYLILIAYSEVYFLSPLAYTVPHPAGFASWINQGYGRQS